MLTRQSHKAIGRVTLEQYRGRESSRAASRYVSPLGYGQTQWIQSPWKTTSCGDRLKSKRCYDVDTSEDFRCLLQREGAQKGVVLESFKRVSRPP